MTKLSILTPTIPGRESQVQALAAKLEKQIGKLPVEHLVLSDNRKRTIGSKRQSLLDVAKGEYVAFVDDDDDVADNYVEHLLAMMAGKPHVITFQQESTYNGLKSKVVFRLGQGDGQYNPKGITQRDAWHVCAWRRDRVKDCKFLFCNYGEDKAWALQARERADTEVHIPEILHYYNHDASTTAAPEGG